jgi:hypothetical protein
MVCIGNRSGQLPNCAPDGADWRRARRAASIGDALYHRHSGIIVIRAEARNLDKPFPKVVPAPMFFYSEVIWGRAMQKFSFDMKNGVPMRDEVGIDFKGNLEAIEHCKELAHHFRDKSLRDDEELEISVLNALGREVHREFVHRE